jgi:hypothetical protein
LPWQRSQSNEKKNLTSNLIQAQLERDYYNENTRIARKEREKIDKNYLQNQGKVEYCSTDANAHYSFDWSQNVQIPYSSQQASQMYFLTALKVHLFGIQNEATKEQLNFVLSENELLNKGINGTFSLVLAGIKQFNRGEEHLKLTCDNAVGQNKNNATIQFCQFLVMVGYYESVELNFMIAGHTKFSSDRNYGMIKKLYRKSTIYCKEDFIKVVKKSSPAVLNKVQCYEEGKEFQYLDFKVLAEYFIKLPNIAKYHHFLFKSSSLGVVWVKEFVDSPLIKINLWKDKNKVAESIREIRSLVFIILEPTPLKLERQEYLYQKIRPLLPERFQDITCPKPIQNINTELLN